jgi:hypothetical protein
MSQRLRPRFAATGETCGRAATGAASCSQCPFWRETAAPLSVAKAGDGKINDVAAQHTLRLPDSIGE